MWVYQDIQNQKGGTVVMNELVFQGLIVLVVVVVSICTALVTKVVVPYIKAQTGEIEYKELLDTIKKAVNAYEQTITASGMGKMKKAQVLAFVSNWLKENEIYISDQQLDVLIEAAVFAMNGGKKEQ
jgi:LL-H family phage holin